MGKTTPSSLNSSVSNSIITNATGSSQQQQQQHQSSLHQQQHQQQQPHPIFPAAAHLPAKLMNSKRKHAKYNSMYSPHMYPDHNNYLHLNSLWSIWYGVLLTLFQGYLAVHGAYRFLGCSLISWKIEPVSELNLQIILSGVVFILLPFFFTSAVFKVGNLANDGIKLATGAKERRCSMVPHDGLEEESRGGTLRALWTHGGPTAAFVHIVIAMCLLLPRLLLEARIIENALLPQETIWQTELDFMTINRRNLVVLSVVTAPYQNHTQQQLYGSQEEDDYYNDTMFTDGSGAGVGMRGISGVGVSNHLLDNEAKQQYEKKHKTLKEAIGKISIFEASDLINRSRVLVDDEQIQQQQFNNVSNKESNKNDQELINKWFRVPAATATTTTATYGGIASTTENIEHLNSSILSFIINTVNISQGNGNMGNLNEMITNTSSTTTIRIDNLNATKTDDEDDSKMPMTATTTINAEDLEEDDKNTATTMITTTTENIDMGTTMMAAELNKTTASLESIFSIALITGNKDITSMTTRKDKTSNSSSTLATATNENHNSNNSFDILMVNKGGVTLTHIEEHHEHQHQHQHQHAHKHQHQHQHLHRQNQQHQHPHHGNHTSKPARKHGHHRPRKLSSSVGSRKHQHTDDASRYLPLNLNSKNKNDEINRVDEIDRLGSPGGIVFEHTAGGVRTAASLNELDFGRARAAIYPKSSTTISTTTRDSNIHIVKPERLPEIIPSTPLASNSKIIEIKTKPSNKIKRATVEIEPQYLVGDLALNDSAEYIAEVGSGVADVSITSSSSVGSSNSDTSADQIVRLDGFAGMLQLFFGIEKQIDVTVFNNPPSAEFVNLMFALMVWCVRYPAVFWTTAKSFATIFSVQIIAAASDIIFSFVGISTLYKLQIYSEAQPVQNPGLILNATVTLSLFLLSAVLMISSSMIMYLYGHGRLAAKMRDRSLITLKSSETWIYFAHCASLCYVLALAVVKAPLLNDLSATYRQNLHCPTFMAALVGVMHLLLWIVIWLGLSAKRRWSFKLPPLDAYGIIGKATTQPLLMHNRGGLSNANTTSGPAANLANGMVLGGGSSLDQKNISTSIITGNGGGGGGGGVSVGGSIVGSLVGGVGSSCVLNTSNNHHHLSNTSTCDAASDAPADDIYWPKLTPSSPKLKVTFNEVPSTCDDDQLLIGDHEQNDGKRSSPRGTAICFTGATGEIDDGEYATLRSATAATVVGIALGSGSGAANKGGPSTTHTAPAGGVKVLHFDEFDELPPPPPPSTHMMSSMTITNHTTAVSVNVSDGADYVNCITALMSSGDDNISEESKLLACVRDDSVTYASTRDLEPPLPPLPPPPPSHPAHYVGSSRAAPHAMPEIMQVSSSSPEHLVSPLAPVTVTVHTHEAHITSSSTTRCLRRADSGVPQEALTPRSETTSMGTESTTSPPERAPSESSSGVHSSEERDMEVVIRPRAIAKPPVKPPQPAIQEEPYGRCTNMRMTSFAGGVNINSATLPMQRTAPEQKFDYSQHCSTMPLPTASHSYTHPANQTPAVYATSAQSMTQSQHQPVTSNVSSFKTPHYANASVALQCLNIVQPPLLPPTPSVTHTVLPNGARYSNPNIMKRLPHAKASESPYGYSGLGPGHYTFSKPGHENNLVNTSIPEDRDSANYSMTSEQDCLYVASNALQ